MSAFDRKFLEEVIAWEKVDKYKNPPSWQGSVFTQRFDVKVVPKERPRTGKGGHVYTPQRTKECEQIILRKLRDTAPLILYPIRLEIIVYELAPKAKRNSIRWLRPSKSDLDNKVKTITDALNGVLYRDDRQISHVDAKCRYTTHEDAFLLRAYRDGLSDNEYNMMQQIAPYAQEE